jgi:hypothetical protein
MPRLNGRLRVFTRFPGDPGSSVPGTIVHHDDVGLPEMLPEITDHAGQALFLIISWNDDQGFHD